MSVESQAKIDTYKEPFTIKMPEKPEKKDEKKRPKK